MTSENLTKALTPASLAACVPCLKEQATFNEQQASLGSRHASPYMHGRI